MPTSPCWIAAFRSALVLAISVISFGCSPRHDGANQLTVFAASSLTEAFQELAAAFTVVNPQAEVSLVFGGSQTLRLQVEHGAPADVFASANTAHMQALVENGLVPSTERLAENELVIAVPPDNPAQIESLSDLPNAKRLVIGVPQVPIGKYTRELLRSASRVLDTDFERRVLERVVSEENNVRLVRAKVELGEADAAIVYRTDAAASVMVRAITIPSSTNVRTEYLVGVVDREGNTELAKRWVAFARSTTGKQILSRHGFVTD